MSSTNAGTALSAEQLETWSAFATLLEWLPSALNEQLQRDSGVTHFEFGIMFALAQADDCTLRMSTLAGYANGTLSRLSRAVARLERNDWIRRRPDPGDGRFTLAILTRAGQRFVDEANPGHADHVRRLVFDSLTPSQAQQLRAISRRITAAIREDEGWRPPA